jgi:alkyldihydroxyacetonephosphate synthase
MQWLKIKNEANRCLLAYGGTATHHHAVGKFHSSNYQQESAPLYLAMLTAAKKQVDPAWILNPEVLISIPHNSKL